MPSVLLIEDDGSIARTLNEYLSAEGFTVTSADSRGAAAGALRGAAFDIILLDVMLPDGNGFTFYNELRRLTVAPVIFLTAADDEASVVRGLDLGAEDYITKPFRPRELISRINGVMRRQKNAGDIRIGAITVDTDRATVMKAGREIALSALEYRILVIFINNRGKLLSRNRLLEEIWDITGDFVNDNTLTVYIKRLREKLEDDPSSPEIIKTVRGLGYRIG